MMSNETNTNNINSEPPSRKQYSESKGTGVLSTLIFAVVTIIFMLIRAYFKAR